MRRIALVAAVAVCFAVVGAQNAFAYVDEGSFLVATSYTDRSSFIIDSNSAASIGGLNFTFKVSSVTSSGNTLITSGVVKPPYATTTGGTPGPNSCVLLGSYALIDTDGNPTKLLVAEVAKTGVQVAKITLNGNAAVNQNNNNTNGKITFTLAGPGTIVIMYTNQATPAG